MSIDLNAELNEFKAMVVNLKDDILRQRDAVNVSTINTVMGSCIDAGIMERDIALAALDNNEVVTTMLESCSDTAAVKAQVAQIMISCSRHAAELVSKEAAKLIADQFLQAISDGADNGESKKQLARHVTNAPAGVTPSGSLSRGEGARGHESAH